MGKLTLARALLIALALTLALAAGYGAGNSGLIGKLAGDASVSDGAAAPMGGDRKPLYYRNPMGLPDTSPVPKKDSMGMDYLPVYAGDQAADDGTVAISPQKIQRSGVVTAPAERRRPSTMIRAPGQIAVDERALSVIAPKFDGWIERLLVQTTGAVVRKGDALAEIYSPKLVVAQQNLLIGGRSAATPASGLPGVGAEQLRLFGIDDDQIQALLREGKVRTTMTLKAPQDGVVLERMAVQGMRFESGATLFRLADLATVWAMIEVYAQDLPDLRVGQKVIVRPVGMHERQFPGTVAFINPELRRDSRTASVRVELANPDGALRIGMLIDAEIAVIGESALMVPASAVLDDGTRRYVLIARGEGKFEPRSVSLGRRSGDWTEIVDGVGEGEIVVVRAAFLIDAESRLRSAIGGFTAPEPAPGAKP